MSEIDFDAALAPLEPKNTARMVLRGVRVNSKHEVRLIGVHAGPLNERFQSLVTKLTKKHVAELAGEDSPTKRALANQIFAEAYARTVLTGWENVCAKDGKPAAFSVADCEAFLRALAKTRPEIAGASGSIEIYFVNASNFADGYQGDAEALGEG